MILSTRLNCMRLVRCVLLVVASSFLSGCDVLPTTMGSDLTAAFSHSITSNNAKSVLRDTEVVEDNEEKTFSDPVINKYLHLFKDWKRQKETPESVFVSLELPAVMRRAYKSGKWKRLLKTENYTIYRKYQKYLKLTEPGGTPHTTSAHQRRK
ncbi:unnamed protein product [Phytophthora fragariaefolia]|uniref:RxLR effector protein n=1 Tax=Phytophthora fragariaefolia TaxID=1490495 RepID=A0A9W7D4R3_9STRA|nr:unnamed protein product [Phytophthora fragariaefolia]